MLDKPKDRLLVIVGSTAVGKTGLALSLAEKFNGELVSADSRQVFRKMDIGTGKDLPKNSSLRKLKNFKEAKYYLTNGVKVWGYDLVDPKEEFSVGQYIRIARKIIKNIWKRDKLAILVGGTGLYIKGVINGIDTASIPKNKKLRNQLENKDSQELFAVLEKLNPKKANSMNKSDRNNPRRLIRAIEISIFIKESRHLEKSVSMNRFIDTEDALFIGLKANKENLFKRIEKRVRKRLNESVIEEIKNLLKEGVDWEDQSMQALGYKQLKSYINAMTTKKEAVDVWIREEKKYAKRQMTWFRKDKRINWFDIDNANFRKNVENLVNKWYSSN